MTAEQTVDLILNVKTLEDFRLAKAVQTKYLQEQPFDSVGWWQVCEAGEILVKLNEDFLPFETDETLLSKGEKYSDLKSKSARKKFRKKINRLYHYSELRREARNYLSQNDPA